MIKIFFLFLIFLITVNYIIEFIIISFINLKRYENEKKI